MSAPVTATPQPLASFDRAPVSLAAAVKARGTVVKSQEALATGEVRHSFTFADGVAVDYTDHKKKSAAKAHRARVVQYMGSEKAAQEPVSTFRKAGTVVGVSTEAADALQFVSRHEGGFDAINTWDSCRFSWGFIQFAGGRGLPRAMALVKSESPALFQKLFADYGVDVLPAHDGTPVCAFVSEKGLLRGKPAEQAYGDSPLVIALFIRAGRVPEVKQRQVEAAIRNYALPALARTYRNVPFSSLFRSPQSLAMLIDRKVHEGNVSRFARALDRVSTGSPRLMEARAIDLAVADAPGDIRARLLDIRRSGLAGPLVTR